MPSIAPPPLKEIEARIVRLSAILERIEEIPSDWQGEKRKLAARVAAGTLTEMVPIRCTSYARVITAWRKAMRWTDGLDCGLSIMIAQAVSTPFVGEQLWVKHIAPPSTGKTTILEGVTVAKRYVYPKDTIRGFHSGWKSPDGEDNSLLALAMGKLLATKDGDTLLKAPNLNEILSEARGIYDRVSRTHYRNDKISDYTGCRLTWALCGTKSLREIDDSELGQRFLDCIIMDEMDDEFEDDVNWRAANQEARNVLALADGSEISQHPPELAEAMQLTGGYVEYLRENAAELICQINMEDDCLRDCGLYGKFVAHMRARPARKGDDDPDREFSPRLVKQHVRLAKFLALVLNRSEVDNEVMRRTHKVAMDTSRGITLKILDRMCKDDVASGLELTGVALATGIEEPQAKKLLRFLRHIKVIERKQGTNAIVWQVAPRMRKLYQKLERV